MTQDNDINVALQLALLKDRRDRILYTYKAHEKAADHIDHIERWRKRASIVLTAVSATTFLASLGGAIGNAQATNRLFRVECG